MKYAVCSCVRTSQLVETYGKTYAVYAPRSLDKKRLVCPGICFIPLAHVLEAREKINPMHRLKVWASEEDGIRTCTFDELRQWQASIIDEELKDTQRAELKKQDLDYFLRGDKVLFVRGPFIDYTAVVQRMKGPNVRVHIDCDFLDRMEVPKSWLKIIKE